MPFELDKGIEIPRYSKICSFCKNFQDTTLGKRRRGSREAYYFTWYKYRLDRNNFNRLARG